MNVAEATCGRDVDDEIRLFCRFTGRVQGVGFRWTMQRLALDVGVKGWVRNEDDGSVSCELQGPGFAVCRVLRGMDREYEKSRRQGRGLFGRSFMSLGFDIAECRSLPTTGDDYGQFRVR